MGSCKVGEFEELGLWTESILKGSDYGNLQLKLLVSEHNFSETLPVSARKWWEAEEVWIMRSFINYTLNQVLLGPSNGG